MNYLSIDTSSTICSVTLFYNSKFDVIEEKNVREHSEHLAPICNQLINNKIKEIDFIALSIGPGSYSGLKTSCSFAKGLAYAINKPIVPVNTFEGMNLSINNKQKYYIALYSHREYAYFQLFKAGKPEEKCKCAKINEMKNYNIYGFGFNNLYKNQYLEIKPSSKNIGMIANEKFDNLSEIDLNNISPIFLSVRKNNDRLV